MHACIYVYVYGYGYVCVCSCMCVRAVVYCVLGMCLCVVCLSSCLCVYATVRTFGWGGLGCRVGRDILVIWYRWVSRCWSVPQQLAVALLSKKEGQTKGCHPTVPRTFILVSR